MLGMEYLNVMNATGAGGTGTSTLSNGVWVEQANLPTSLMYISAASRVTLRCRVAFGGGSALTGIAVQLLGADGSGNFGNITVTRQDVGQPGTLAAQTTITPADVTNAPGGLIVIESGGTWGMDGGFKIQVKAAGVPVAGDSIQIDVRAV